MVILPSNLGEILKVLHEQGFQRLPIKGEFRRFLKEVALPKSTVQIEIRVADWSFVNYPVVILKNRSSCLPENIPHVDKEGVICYFSSGSVILDRYDPVGAILQCTQQVEHILNESATNPDYVRHEFEREFFSYWVLGAAKSRHVLKYTKNDSCNSSANLYSYKTDNGFCVGIISDNRNDADRIISATHKSAIFSEVSSCWIISTLHLPSISLDNASNLGSIVDWLNSWDTKIWKAIGKILRTEKSYLLYNTVCFLIQTKQGEFGFSFKLENYHRLCTKNFPKTYFHRIERTKNSIEVERFLIDELSDDFIYGRNLSYATLANKRITIVGCGAIGSFLAESLARIGAGSGRGILRLIDNDIFSPENIGRHTLGISSLYKNKSRELAQKIKSLFPASVNVTYETESAVNVKNLFAADLVIDATGEEAFSEHLNYLAIALNKSPAILFVRIRGNGESVQTFWFEGRRDGCFHCLMNRDHNGWKTERFKLLKNKPMSKYVGCKSFTPYAISAPLSAAALATEMVCDWLQGNVNPKFRTQSSSSNTTNVYSVRNQTISKRLDCPICSKKSS